MNDMKCPFCGEKIEHIEDGWCNCKNRCTGSGSIELWLQFLRTRKALDVAVDALKDTNGYLYGDYKNTKWDLHKTIRQALEQITAPEQKE